LVELPPGTARRPRRGGARPGVVRRERGRGIAEPPDQLRQVPSAEIDRRPRIDELLVAQRRAPAHDRPPPGRPAPAPPDAARARHGAARTSPPLPTPPRGSRASPALPLPLAGRAGRRVAGFERAERVGDRRSLRPDVPARAGRTNRGDPTPPRAGRAFSPRVP